MSGQDFVPSIYWIFFHHKPLRDAILEGRSVQLTLHVQAYDEGTKEICPTVALSPQRRLSQLVQSIFVGSE